MSDNFIGYFRRCTTKKLEVTGEMTIGNRNILATQGNTYFVDSGVGSDSNSGLSWTAPLATLDAAIGKCTASQDDVIIVAAGHAETYSTTGAKVVADVKGVTIFGLGTGSDRPTFTFSHTGATWTISAANVTLYNLLFATNVDLVTTFGTISGNDCTMVNCETRDTTDKEAVDSFIVTGDRFICSNHVHNGYVDGDANARVFKMNGVDGAYFEKCKFFTKVTTAAINFVTAPCTNVIVDNCDFYVNGTTNYSKNIVDTITGSKWRASGFDIGAGSTFSGGSGSALAADDLSAIASAVSVVDGLMNVPTADLATNATMNQVIGNKSDTVSGTSIVSLEKQALAAVGTLANTGGTATIGGIFGDVKNISIASQLMDGYKKTTIADGTTIPNNTQDAAGLLATATGGDILIEEIIWQRAADNLVGPTNYEFTTDNVAGLTGAAAPNGVAILAKFNANKTCVLSLDGTTKQIPFVLESTKKLYIHGDDAATSAGGSTNFYIKYKRLAAGATLA